MNESDEFAGMEQAPSEMMDFSVLEPVEEKVWFLTGPTASGKSDIGLRLAEMIGAEIVSLDSMALYREMDIGTAKPAAESRDRVPHHLLDLLDPQEEFSLAQYVALARRTINEIRGRGREPLFVGGTPLYLKALLRGLFTGPPPDWERRAEWTLVVTERGSAALHDALGKVDPEAAKRLKPTDMRRIIRALEVHEKLGQPLSELQRQFDRARPASACRVFVLDWPREKLYERINRRVDEMIAAGLVDEVRDLLARHGRIGRTASQGLGYKEVMGYLAGEYNLETTVELVKTRTRRFAKRQLTWFRSLSECRWIPLNAESDPAAVARAIQAAGEAVTTI